MINPIRQIYSAEYSSFKALNQLIVSLFPKRSGKRSRCERRFYDTFDWRLFSAGYLLEENIRNSTHTFHLRSMSDDAFIIEETCTVLPRLYWDLPSGQLKNKLKPVISQRALISLGLLYVSRTQYEITDSEDKIILRIVSEGLFNDERRHQKSGIMAYLELHPLRGYEKEMKRILGLLSTKFNFYSYHKNSALRLLEALDETPESYTSKFDIVLEPDMPGQSALSSALIYNLDIMEKNETGILKDIDIEFLHDFRIAGRRSRSVVGQVRDVFPNSRLSRFKNSLSWLSKLTSSHRDLDVFLWDFNDYIKQVSPNGGEELEPLRRLLQRRRTQEHKRLVNALNTKRFDRFKTDWRNFLEEGQKKSLNARNSTVPIIDVANQSIWRNYKKLLHQGDIIKTNYTFDSIHTMRKNAKKLRYLIDTFKSLYPENDMQAVRKYLKRLQNDLGEITDMHVQRDMLYNWKIALIANQKIPPLTITAIDELENQCTLNEKSAQKKFKRRYQEFSSKNNRYLFQKIFKSAVK